MLTLAPSSPPSFRAALAMSHVPTAPLRPMRTQESMMRTTDSASSSAHATPSSSTAHLARPPTTQLPPPPPQSQSQLQPLPQPPTGAPSPSAPSVLTLDAVLEQHAHAPSPTYAALEATLAERNLLAAQNAQLWKLIEKQRSGYAGMVKDLDRIRAERDAYKHRLHAVGQSTDGLVRRERERQKALKASASGSVLPAPNAAGGRESPVDPRAAMVRHRSEDSSAFLCSRVVSMQHGRLTYSLLYSFKVSQRPVPDAQTAALAPRVRGRM
jgi:hypothetical protein